MDATNMTYPSESFDAVIDKGTLDALAVKTIQCNQYLLFSVVFEGLYNNR